MTTVSISRKKICEAIAKEPTTTLQGGSWAASDGKARYHSSVRTRNCKVCAVGAVMRNACLAPTQVWGNIQAAADASTGNGDPRGDALHEAKKGRYMAALSSFFEGEFEDRRIIFLRGRERMAAVKQLKTDCIRFVEKNFPSKLEIDIDGAKPAKDIKVVHYDSDDQD